MARGSNKDKARRSSQLDAQRNKSSSVGGGGKKGTGIAGNRYVQRAGGKGSG